MIKNIGPSALNLNTQTASELKNAEDNHQYIPDPYKKFAKDQEVQFIEFMLGQMDKTIDKSDQDSTASSYYNSLMINERAKQMAESKGGLGIQDLILDQVYPQKFRNRFAYEQYLRQASLQNGSTQNHTQHHPVELKDGSNE